MHSSVLRDPARTYGALQLGFADREPLYLALASGQVTTVAYPPVESLSAAAWEATPLLVDDLPRGAPLLLVGGASKSVAHMDAVFLSPPLTPSTAPRLLRLPIGGGSSGTFGEPDDPRRALAAHAKAVVEASQGPRLETIMRLASPAEKDMLLDVTLTLTPRAFFSYGCPWVAPEAARVHYLEAMGGDVTVDGSTGGVADNEHATGAAAAAVSSFSSPFAPSPSSHTGGSSPLLHPSGVPPAFASPAALPWPTLPSGISAAASPAVRAQSLAPFAAMAVELGLTAGPQPRPLYVRLDTCEQGEGPVPGPALTLASALQHARRTSTASIPVKSPLLVVARLRRTLPATQGPAHEELLCFAPLAGPAGRGVFFLLPALPSRVLDRAPRELVLRCVQKLGGKRDAPVVLLPPENGTTPELLAGQPLPEALQVDAPGDDAAAMAAYKAAVAEAIVGGSARDVPDAATAAVAAAAGAPTQLGGAAASPDVVLRAVRRGEGALSAPPVQRARHFGGGDSWSTSQGGVPAPSRPGQAEVLAQLTAAAATAPKVRRETSVCALAALQVPTVAAGVAQASSSAQPRPGGSVEREATVVETSGFVEDGEQAVTRPTSPQEIHEEGTEARSLGKSSCARLPRWGDVTHPRVLAAAAQLGRSLSRAASQSQGSSATSSALPSTDVQVTVALPEAPSVHAPLALRVRPAAARPYPGDAPGVVGGLVSYTAAALSSHAARRGVVAAIGKTVAATRATAHLALAPLERTVIASMERYLASQGGGMSVVSARDKAAANLQASKPLKSADEAASRSSSDLARALSHAREVLPFCRAEAHAPGAAPATPSTVAAVTGALDVFSFKGSGQRPPARAVARIGDAAAAAAALEGGATAAGGSGEARGLKLRCDEVSSLLVEGDDGSAPAAKRRRLDAASSFVTGGKEGPCAGSPAVFVGAESGSGAGAAAAASLA